MTKVISEARKSTLATKVLEMSMYELKLALLLILDGADVDYAIETALIPRKKRGEP